jgi:N-acetylglucosaminyldiphosphoundecaprenol N-acetyl-beta-D-mannosaminyltransferase
MEDVLNRMGADIAASGKPQTISITNTESAYYAVRMPEHLDYVRNATFSCCDGVGVVLVGRLRGGGIPRLYGPELMLRACKYGVSRGWRHYFYGGKEGVSELLSQKLTGRYPGLITAGAYCPPFRPLTLEEDAAVVEMIRKARPDIVWVGLGLLKQEKWIAEHLTRVGASWMIGVGAAFDFHAGTAKRPPGWVSTLGFEWLYRFVREPRMFKRNLRSFAFLLSGAQEALRCRLGALPRAKG